MRTNTFVELPILSRNVVSSWTVKDSFHSGSSNFEKTLHQEIERVREDENVLHSRLKQTNFAAMNKEERAQLQDQFASVKRRKALLALLVENMQKCSAAIAQNFR